MKDIRSRIRMRLPDKHLKGCMQIVATEIQPDIERLLKQKQCQMSH
jgi:hypothetical protein